MPTVFQKESLEQMLFHFHQQIKIITHLTENIVNNVATTMYSAVRVLV